MNEKAILEIGNYIRVSRGGWLLQKLTAEEIIKTFEYLKFKESCPELCKLEEETK